MGSPPTAYPLGMSNHRRSLSDGHIPNGILSNGSIPGHTSLKPDKPHVHFDDSDDDSQYHQRQYRKAEILNGTIYTGTTGFAHCLLLSFSISQLSSFDIFVIG